jgi:amino acid permease
MYCGSYVPFPSLSPWLFRKKSIDELEKRMLRTHALRRVLGPWELIFLGIGAIVGTGIFVITGVAAADFAGPGVILSFIFAGQNRSDIPSSTIQPIL